MLTKVSKKVMDSLNRIYLNECYIPLFIYLVIDSIIIITWFVKLATHTYRCTFTAPKQYNRPGAGSIYSTEKRENV